MLIDILISKVRVKILELFLANPDSIYHVREIVRRVAEEINAVRRELARLEKTITETEKAFKEASSKFNQKELDEAISIISEKKSHLENMQKEHIDTIARIRAFEIRKLEQQDTKNKISRMILCPTSTVRTSSHSCRQNQKFRQTRKTLLHSTFKRYRGVG